MFPAALLAGKDAHEAVLRHCRRPGPGVVDEFRWSADAARSLEGCTGGLADALLMRIDVGAINYLTHVVQRERI